MCASDAALLFDRTKADVTLTCGLEHGIRFVAGQQEVVWLDVPVQRGTCTHTLIHLSLSTDTAGADVAKCSAQRHVYPVPMISISTTSIKSLNC